MTEDVEIGSCPFCGSSETRLYDAWHKRDTWVYCIDCLATGPVKETEREAIDAWNMLSSETGMLREEHAEWRQLRRLANRFYRHGGRE